MMKMTMIVMGMMMKVMIRKDEESSLRMLVWIDSRIHSVGRLPEKDYLNEETFSNRYAHHISKTVTSLKVK